MAYRLLSLTAISGEFPTDQLNRLPGSPYYLESVVTALKKDGLLRTYYRDKLRGYRLGPRAKATLLESRPDRFASYLTGDTDTNRLKCEIDRRLRLHRLAETYVTMDNAGVCVYRDEKPAIFAPDGYAGGRIVYPAFFSSREVKEMGIDTTKIRSSRSTGILLAPSGIFVTYNSSSALMKWRYKSEMRVKALIWSVICQQRLAPQFRHEDVHGLILGNSMDLAYQILTSTGGRKHDFFMLDGSYEHFLYLTNNHQGEVILPADTGNSLDLNELLGQMDQPLEDTSAEYMAEDPLPELTEEEMFGDTPAETDDQSAAPTDMPEDFDVQPPDVYEDNADAVQEPPASPKPKRTSRKKKEAAAPEETVTEEVPAETTESADTADSILDTEEPAVEPDVPVVEEAAAPAPTPSPPQRQPRPQRGEAPVLTIRSRDDVETAEDRDDVIWHEIHNAYRTRKIITGKLGGIEQLDNRKTVAVVDYKGFRVIIPIKEMMINLGRSPSGQEYADLMLRQNKILGNMLGADIDFIVRGIDSKTRSVVASRKEAMLRKRQIFYLDTDAAGMYRVYEGRIVQARVIAVAEKVVRVEVFGVETSILARDLAWDWIGDAHERFSVGDEVLVRILSVRRNSLEDLGIKADIKSISENTDRDNLQKCRIQGKYAGRVTDVHKGVVYVRLSNGVNAVAHSCYDYRMPGKKDDVSFAVTRLDMERGVAVGIITRIIRQNL